MKYLKIVQTDAELIDPHLDSPAVYLSLESGNMGYFGIKQIPNNEIWYTTTDGQILELSNILEWWGEDEFNPNLETKVRYTLLSNTYENGIGKMVFADDVIAIGYTHHKDDDENWIIDDVYPLLSPYVDGSTVIKESNLKTLILPSSVTNIGDEALENCDNLTEYVISNNVTNLGYYAFYGCSKIENVILGDSVENIKDETFFECINLTSIVIPKSVTSIGAFVFSKCNKLANITYKGTIEQWNSITKESTWKPKGIAATVVHCSDGDVAL